MQIVNLEKVNQIQSKNLKTLQSRQILLIFLLLISVSFIFTLLIIRKKLKTKNSTIYQQNGTIKDQFDEIKLQNGALDQYKNHLEELVNEKTMALKKALEKVELSDKLKTAFLQNLSHEIRTPMNAVLGFTNVLAMNDENLLEEYNIIKQNFHQLLNLIDDILLLSKLQTKQYNSTKSEISLNGLMSEIKYFIESEISNQNKAIEVFLNLNPDHDIIINTDKKLFYKLFYCLSDNAIKYTDQGRIELGFEHQKNNVINLYIKDSGIGIDKNELPYIYDFFRKVEGKERLFSGTGIGLAIVKKGCELLDAKVSVKSEINKGSEFIIAIENLSLT